MFLNVHVADNVEHRGIDATIRVSGFHPLTSWLLSVDEASGLAGAHPEGYCRGMEVLFRWQSSNFQVVPILTLHWVHIGEGVLSKVNRMRDGAILFLSQLCLL